MVIFTPKTRIARWLTLTCLHPSFLQTTKPLLYVLSFFLCLLYCLNLSVANKASSINLIHSRYMTWDWNFVFLSVGS